LADSPFRAIQKKKAAAIHGTKGAAHVISPSSREKKTQQGRALQKE
jgi:hypothetical protein